jgi:hypothetical protein
MAHDWMSLADVLGRAIDHDDKPAALELLFRLDVEENPAARQAAGQLKRGTASEWSVGFTREDDEPSEMLPGATRITKSYLDEVCIVPVGPCPGRPCSPCPGPPTPGSWAFLLGTGSGGGSSWMRWSRPRTAPWSRRPWRPSSSRSSEPAGSAWAEVQRRMAAAISGAVEAEKEADAALELLAARGLCRTPEAPRRNLGPAT